MADHLEKERRCYAIVVHVLPFGAPHWRSFGGLGLSSPAHANGNEPAPPSAGDTSAPAPEKREVTVDGKTEVIESNLPWKLVKDEETDKLRLFVGPGVDDAALPGPVVEEWDGPEALQSADVGTMANWYCEPHSQDPRRSGGQIQGYAGASCFNGPMPTYRLQWQFERHAPITESITGWKQYSARRYTAWTTAMATGTNIYAQCNTADGRTRAYTTYHRGETTGGYVWSWHRSATSISWFGCGYSEF